MDRDHLDPEIVAAWVDGTLDAHTRAGAEAHAADCARCQAVLAAMVRIEPAPAAKPWFSRATVRWLVPLTAAAAAVAIWVAVTPQTDQRHPAAPAAAKVESAPSAAPVEENAQVRTIPERSVRAVPPAAAATDRQTAARRERAAEPRQVAQNAPGPPATPPALDQVQPPATGGGAALSESVRTQASLQKTAADSLEARGVVARKMAVSTFAERREIRTVDGAVQWRIDPPAQISRSSDAGKTWIPQASGVTTELTAGSAPSVNAVWIVGRAGVVLLSTDGHTWRRVTFPETVDLVGVMAIDARSATVMAADGRRFSTFDGGATWTHQLPKSQLPRAK